MRKRNKLISTLMPLCLLCNLVALSRTAAAADAPQEQVIATVQGTDILAKDVHPARARILTAFKKAHSVEYDPKVGQHRAMIKEIERKLLVKALCAKIRLVIWNSALKRFKVTVTKQDVDKTLEKTFGKSSLQNHLAEHENQRGSLLKAVRYLKKHPSAWAEGYEKFLKDVVPRKRWLLYEKAYPRPSHLPYLEAGLQRKTEDVVAGLRKSIRMVLVKERLTNRLLLHLAKKYDQVAEYLISVLDTGERDFLYENRSLRIWLRRQYKAADVQMTDRELRREVMRKLLGRQGEAGKGPLQRPAREQGAATEQRQPGKNGAPIGRGDEPR